MNHIFDMIDYGTFTFLNLQWILEFRPKTLRFSEFGWLIQVYSL